MAQSSENCDRDPAYVQFILKNVLRLETFNDLDVKEILREPEFRNLLTPLEIQKLELDKTPIEKRGELRDIITTRWTFDDFEAFLNVLMKHHSHITEALKTQLDRERFYHPILPAPEAPNLSPLPSQASQPYDYMQTVPKVAASAQAEGHPNPRDRYSMDTSPRGLAVVINNQTFTHLGDRQGSEQDKKCLSKVFEYLDFKVFFKNDLKASCMRNLLQTFATDERLKKVSSIIVVVLTHGMEDGVLFGSDGRVQSDKRGSKIVKEPVDGTFITRLEVQKIFNSTSCPLMKGKPKGFFLQACRGVDEDLQETKEKTSNRLHSDGHLAEETDGPRQSCSRNRLSLKTVPDTADFIFAFPSTSGYKAYRQPKTGSPFIASLTRLIQQHASHLHFEDILKKQRQEFREALSNDAFMMPESTSTLDKHWYFNPPPRDV